MYVRIPRGKSQGANIPRGKTKNEGVQTNEYNCYCTIDKYAVMNGALYRKKKYIYDGHACPKCVRNNNSDILTLEGLRNR